MEVRNTRISDSDPLKGTNRSTVVLLSLLVVFLLSMNSFGPAHASAPPSINPEPASLVIGQANFTANASRSGPAGLSEPEFVAFDHSGDLWVSDYNNSLAAEYTPPFTTGESASLEVGSASFSTTGCAGTGAENVCSPHGIAFDPSGNLWVSDSENSSIVEFQAPFTTGEKSSVVLGEYSDGQPNATNLDEPFGIAFDSSGNLWVADSNDNRIVEYKAPLTSDEGASLVLGQTSLTSATDNVAQANMSGPEDIAFDRSGNLWVADTENSRILEFFAPFSDGERASEVIGEPNFNSFGGNDTQSTVALPEAIAFDHSGDLWVSDSGNSRVLEFPAALTAGENASDLIGQYSYFYGGPNSTRYQLGYPDGIAFDSSGNLWVADSGYARVLEYSNPLTYKPSSTTSSSTTSSSSQTATMSTTVVVATSRSVITTTPAASNTTSVVTTSSPIATTSAASTASTSSTSSKSGGGVPVFPYQFSAAAIFTFVLAASYLLIRRRTALKVR